MHSSSYTDDYKLSHMLVLYSRAWPRSAAPPQPLRRGALLPLRSPPASVGPVDGHRVDAPAAPSTRGVATGGRGGRAAAAAGPLPAVLATPARGRQRRRRRPRGRRGHPHRGDVCPATAAATAAMMMAVVVVRPSPTAGWVHRTPLPAGARRRPVGPGGPLCQRRPHGGAIPPQPAVVDPAPTPPWRGMDWRPLCPHPRRMVHRTRPCRTDLARRRRRSPGVPIVGISNRWVHGRVELRQHPTARRVG